MRAVVVEELIGPDGARLADLALTGISMDIHEQAYPGTMAMVNAAVQELADAGTIHPLIGARVPLADGAERRVVDCTISGRPTPARASR